MFGPQMRAPTGEPAQLEAAVLAEAGLTISAFEAAGKLGEGTRRPLCVQVSDVAPVTDAPDGSIVLSFALPAGSYATVLLAEIMG